jgi:hypothetical protein
MQADYLAIAEKEKELAGKRRVMRAQIIQAEE